MLLRSILTSVVLTLVFVLSISAPATAQLRATLVAGSLSRPVAFVQDPSNPAVQMVVEQGGRVRVLLDGLIQPTDYLNLTGQISSTGERGLLGLAFAPDYAVSGRVFASFTDLNGHSVIARFTRAAGDPLQADPASRFDLVWPGGLAYIEQPFPNHNGGHIAFGPDGFLYYGLGDGGSGNDPDHRAQDPTTLLGKMLRIDVSVPDSDPEGYDVPPGNPFVADAMVLDEIWAFGFRNPWRWSFDDPARGGTGALIVADVGEGTWEEINYEPEGAGGRNYGWRNREGAHDHVTTLPPHGSPLTDPIFEYPRSDGEAVTGGFVYRGSALPASYVGRYFFADFVTSRIWSLGLSIDGTTGEATATNILEHTAEFNATNSAPSSFGIDADGELYFLSHNGAVYRIEAAASSCATVQPGPDWTCYNGGWLPPGMTPPGGGTPPPPPPPPPPPTTDCSTVQPGPDWTCYNGGWLPPGIAPPGGTPPPPPPPPPPPSGDCTTVQPGPDWTCSNGGWLPPGVTPPGGTPPPPPPPPPTGCTTVQPGPGWICREGGWVPPDYPGV